MKQIILAGILALIGVLGWRMGSELSSDAISMAVGVLFGVLAGVPTALLVLASARRRDPHGDDGDDWNHGRGTHNGPYGGYLPQPPVIVVTGAPPNGANAQGQSQYALPAPHSMPQGMQAGDARDIAIDAREFRVVGETEEWIDEW